jgi:hypothetical protein
MLRPINTQQPAASQVSAPNQSHNHQQLSWAEWLDRTAAAFDRAAARAPYSDRLAFIGSLIREAASQAHIMNLQSPGEHADFLAELCETTQALAGQDHTPAAPTQPGSLAGHPDTWDIPTGEVEDILPW